MIRLEGVCKRYGEVEVLKGVTFEVPRGKAAALWGPNGAGKSTTLRCLLGLDRFYKGTASVDGVDVTRKPREVRRRVGYVPQEFAYYDLTVGDSLELFCGLKGVPLTRGAEVLAQVGLSGEREKAVGALSGGMRQRLALALALLADPPVLLLDEPTASLDAASRRQLLGVLAAERERGKTILFASHRPEEVLELADLVLVMEGGRVTQTLMPREFAGRQDAAAWLHLRLVNGQARLSREVLAAAGFVLRTDGDRLAVRVEPGARARPLGLLFQAGIAVADFELEGEAWTAPH